MSEAVFQTLLRELFQGDDDRLRELLRPLTAERRKALFAEFEELFKVLQRACRYQLDARPVKLTDLYRAIQDDPVGFLRDQATSLAAPGALNNPQALQGGLFQQRAYGSLMAFYSRLNLLRAGLAGKAGVAGAFKASSRQPVRTQKFVLYAGRVLLDRPEPWIGDALANVFEQVLSRARFTGGDQGVARLMLEARQQHPDWGETLAPYVGMAMRRDGFFSHALKGFDSAMILAGLEYESPAQEGFFEPLFDVRVVETLLRRLGDGSLPRADLLALILRKLQSPLRPSVAKCWLDLFDRLAPTAAEIREHAGSFIDLLNAPAPAAGKLAFRIVEQHFLDDASRAMELLNAFEYGLRNPVQALAKSALRLLKKQVKRHADWIAPGISAAVGGLSSPHAALRAELLRWLGGLQPEQLGEEMRRQLQETAAALPATELGPIAHLLAEAPAVRETGLAEASGDGRSEVLAAVATLRQRVAEHSGESVWSQRLTYLENYLATGRCDELGVKTPDHSAALSPPDFVLHETAEAVALGIVNVRDRVLTQADYERILAGLLRFAPSAHSARITAILGPLLERQEEWRQGSLAGSDWWGRGQELAALGLARAWRGEALPSFPKNSRGGQLLDSQFRPAQRRRLRHVAALMAAGHDRLLSTPTHAAGWLSPAVFAERFNALPAPLFYADELGAALYRLPDLPGQRADAWSRLELGKLDAVLVENLTLALAPPAEAEAALERLLRRFEKQPPTEPLFYALSGDLGDGGRLVETLKAKIFRHDPHAVENAAFRLFGAALRCRFGLKDAGISGRAPRLLERLSSARGWFSRMFQEQQLRASLLAELLFAPQPVTEKRVEPFSASLFTPFDQETSHPCLWPYVLVNTQHFATPQIIADHVFRFPPLAQRFFEAGLCRQNRKDDYYRDLTAAMLAQGKQPQVDVRPHLGQMTVGLLATQPTQRENGVDLLAQALHDGRASPSDLAGALADQIKVTDKGYAQLDQALASLVATGEAGRATVLLASERVIGGGVAEFSPRKLSLMLERLADILNETRRAVTDPNARRQLEQLAAAKKKSVTRDKARMVVARCGPADQPPLQVMAVAALGRL
ncbi:MAG TPA: DUF6493 family protein [Candidatus Competibacter sp.]|nr:hypothetical protein [Candidatus Competibacteraceae bacterium]HRC71377.1 DUF6493 family protein [Candidatus Competibacter sp.]